MELCGAVLEACHSPARSPAVLSAASANVPSEPCRGPPWGLRRHLPWTLQGLILLGQHAPALQLILGSWVCTVTRPRAQQQCCLVTAGVPWAESLPPEPPGPAGGACICVVFQGPCCRVVGRSATRSSTRCPLGSDITMSVCVELAGVSVDSREAGVSSMLVTSFSLYSQATDSVNMGVLLCAQCSCTCCGTRVSCLCIVMSVHLHVWECACVWARVLVCACTGKTSGLTGSLAGCPRPFCPRFCSCLNCFPCAPKPGRTPMSGDSGGDGGQAQAPNGFWVCVFWGLGQVCAEFTGRRTLKENGRKTSHPSAPGPPTGRSRPSGWVSERAKSRSAQSGFPLQGRG